MNVPAHEIPTQPGGIYDVLSDEFRMYGQADFARAVDGLVAIYNDNYAHHEACMMQDALDQAAYTNTDTNAAETHSVSPTNAAMYPPIALGAALGLYSVRKAYGEAAWEQIRNQTVIDWTIHSDEDTATELNALMRFEFIDRSMKHITSNPFSRLNTAGLWLGYEIGNSETAEFIRGFGHIALLARTTRKRGAKQLSSK